ELDRNLSLNAADGGCDERPQLRVQNRCFRHEPHRNLGSNTAGCSGHRPLQPDTHLVRVKVHRDLDLQALDGAVQPSAKLLAETFKLGEYPDTYPCDFSVPGILHTLQISRTCHRNKNVLLLLLFG